MKPPRLAVYGLAAASLLGGGAAGLALGVPALAGAQTADSTDTTATTPAPADSGTTADPGTTTPAPAAAVPAPAPAPADPNAPAPALPKDDWAKSALDALVKDGTITQAQEDKVLAALQAARPAHGGPGHRGGPDGFRGGRDLDVAAQAIGVTVDELRTALQSGQSLADVAKSKGVDPAKVVDALVASLKAHLDQEVASGRHTQAEADQMLASAKTRIEAFVNGQMPLGGLGFGGGHHGFGGGFPGGPPPAGTGTAPSTAPAA